MDIDKERAAFEAWALKERVAYRDEQHGLCFYDTGSGAHQWIGWQARAALARQDTAPPAAVPAPDKPTWTCFHCSESFHDRAAAELHFGSSEMQEPMCKVDQIKFRETEALMRRYTAEDTDLHREIYRLNTEHNAALRRAEEEGYAKGLKATAPAQAVDALGIKTWQERLLDDRVSTAIMRAKARDAEIADLRAALAAQPAARKLSPDAGDLRKQWAAVDAEIGGKAMHVAAFDDGANCAQPAAPAGEPVATKGEIYTLRRLIECAEELNKRPRPMCRDCADEDGTCPTSKLECDMRKLFADAKALHNKLAAPVANAGQRTGDAS